MRSLGVIGSRLAKVIVLAAVGLLILPLAVQGWAEETLDPKSAADRAAMQGDWMTVSMRSSGMDVPREDAQALFRTVRDNGYEVSRYTKVVSRGTFVLDATKSPKTIDSTPAGVTDPAKAVLGIYEFDGPRLKICNASPGKPRPTSFDAQLGSGQTTIVWEPETQ